MILLRNRRAHHALQLAIALGVTLSAAATVPARLVGQAVAEVQVTPETMTIGVSQKQTIFAAAYDRRGNLISGAKFTFWSSDTSIARVLRDGTVLGVQPGLAKIEARAQGRRASLAVLITGNAAAKDDKPPSGAVLTLDPAALVLLPGETGRMTPQAVREDGSALSLGRVTWKSLKPEVATVDSSGAVVGVTAGRSIIQATSSNGLMATAPVEVTQADFTVVPDRLILGPQGTDTLRAKLPTQGDRRLDSGIHWRALDSAVAIVSPTGVVRGEAPGKTEIVAAGFGQERRVAVVVHKAPEALVVSPRPRGRIQMPRTGTRKFSAVVEAADSTPIPEIGVGWVLRDTTTATFDAASGTLIAKAIGTTTLTATAPGFKPVVWTIDVIPGFVHLSRDRMGLLSDTQTPIDAMLLDDAGKPVGETSELQWASDQPAVATVDANGTVHGVAPGRAMITATASWGQSDTVVVFVTGDLVLTSNRGGTFNLYTVVRAKPDTLLPIISDNGTNIDGVYSPDRTRLAFSSNRAGSYDLYVADADGANPRRVTSDAGDETEPVWTPDGTGLLYTAAAPGTAPQVHVVVVDNGTPRALTSGKGGNSSPAMSPDGRMIAFVSTRDKDPNIYVAAADGSNPRRITDSSEREFLLRFFPNGDLLYAAERGRGKSAHVIRQTPTLEQTTKLFDTDQPLVALGVSRDGTWMAYAVGKVTDRAKGRAKFSLYLRPVAQGVPIPVPLHPDEQISSIAF